MVSSNKKWWEVEDAGEEELKDEDVKMECIWYKYVMWINKNIF